MAWFGRKARRTMPSPLTNSPGVIAGTHEAVKGLAHDIAAKEGEFTSRIDRMADTLRAVIERMEKDGARIHHRR